MVVNEKFIENGKVEIRDFILLCMDADKMDEDGFICSQCGDTVTAVDFPYLEVNSKNEAICPICGQVM
jgi:rubrerythrin